MSLLLSWIVAQESPINSVLPWREGPRFLELTASQWLGLFLLGVAAWLIGALGQWLLVRGGWVVVERTSSVWDNQIVAILPGPLRWLIGLLAFELGSSLLDLAPEAQQPLSLLVRSLLIVAATILASRLVGVLIQGLESSLMERVTDDNRLRSIRTQIAIPKAVLRFVVILLGIALIFLQFDVVRSVGMSLLASAGIAGIVIGLAAQRVVSNLLAGVQVALFQPIRIGDAVVVEGDWGWIEEIGLTHVVIKIWDLRRLVVPVSFFLDRPFHNWTLGSSDLLGTVLLYVDYTVPVEAVREELARFLEHHPLWDRRAQGVQVTNLTSDHVELRIVVSAAHGSALWDLRCQVRERMLAWLQTVGQPHLPRNRVALVDRPDSQKIPD